MPRFDYDLFVIGGGSGGVRAARIAAGHGARVALAEASRFGGTCVIRGCVPKKLMVLAGRFADEFDDAVGFGWTLTTPEFRWPSLIAAKDREIARLEGLYAKSLRNAGVELFECRAVVAGPQQIELSALGRQVSAEHILIATGGEPLLPPVAGVELAISSDEMFDLPVQPRRLLVVGAGYIAVEFASLMRQLGSEVVMSVRGDGLLRGFDDELRHALQQAMRDRGVDVRTGCRPNRIERGRSGLLIHFDDGTGIEVDQVLMATGRRPSTRCLGLEEAGVRLGEQGEVWVDEYSRSSVPSIHAVGDVTNRVPLTPVAIREGHAFADTVFGKRPRKVDYSVVGTAVFSTPELGTVGLSEQAAKERHAHLDIYRASFRPLKATLSGRDERMLMKLIVDADSDRVLGAHLLGPDAGELVQLLAIAVQARLRKADFDDTIAVHPSIAEELVTMSTVTERWRRED